MTEQFPPNPVGARGAVSRPEDKQPKRHPMHAREEAAATASPSDKNVEQVVHSKVVRRKKPWGQKVADMVDAGGVVGYMLGDVLIPTLRASIVEAFAGGLERAIYGGDVRPGNRLPLRPGGGVGPVPYHNRYHSSAPVRGNAPIHEPRRLVRRHEEWEQIIVATQAEAREVVDRLWDLANRYPAATVADYYEMLGQTPSFTDERRGWTVDTLQYADIKRVREGWLIVLPDPESVV